MLYHTCLCWILFQTNLHVVCSVRKVWFFRLFCRHIHIFRNDLLFRHLLGWLDICEITPWKMRYELVLWTIAVSIGCCVIVFHFLSTRMVESDVVTFLSLFSRYHWCRHRQTFTRLYTSVVRICQDNCSTTVDRTEILTDPGRTHFIIFPELSDLDRNCPGSWQRNTKSCSKLS